MGSKRVQNSYIEIEKNNTDESTCREGMKMQNELVDPVGEGESRTTGESSIDVDTPLRVKQIASGKLLYNTGSPAWCL